MSKSIIISAQEWTELLSHIEDAYAALTRGRGELPPEWAQAMDHLQRAQKLMVLK